MARGCLDNVFVLSCHIEPFDAYLEKSCMTCYGPLQVCITPSLTSGAVPACIKVMNS